MSVADDSNLPHPTYGGRSSVVVGVVALMIATLVAGCYVTPHRPVLRDNGPAIAPPWLVDLPDPEPTNEPKSARGNGNPYTVFGRTYYVRETAAGYDATGIASWYGAKFHGRPTSNGETYDMYALTAAHRALPLPCYVRVTRVDNGRSTIVRVNDRGPFHDDRLIDLSYAAAVKLGFEKSGIARVRVQVVGSDASPSPAPRAAPVVVGRADEQGAIAEVASRTFFLQAGAFRTLAVADRVTSRLRGVVGDKVFVVRVPSDRLFRVRVGPIRGDAELERIKGLVAAAGASGAVTVE